MTKRDYQLIAKVLERASSEGVQGLLNWGGTCEDMARELAKENPRFDTVTFLDACGFDVAFGRQWRQDYAA